MPHNGQFIIKNLRLLCAIFVMFFSCDWYDLWVKTVEISIESEDPNKDLLPVIGKVGFIEEALNHEIKTLGAVVSIFYLHLSVSSILFPITSRRSLLRNFIQHILAPL